jgi:hypothetical protein
MAAPLAPDPCRCPACLPSIPPHLATASAAELSAHREHLGRLVSMSSSPDPDFHPYPQSAPAATVSNELLW